MAEELLEKIPRETCWAITAKTLTKIIANLDASLPPLLGKGEGFIAPVMGLEKYLEINTKIWGDGGKLMFPFIKETFNIPVEDAVGAVKLLIVAVKLLQGPEVEYPYIVEATPERFVVRWPKCMWMEHYKEFEVDPAFIPCVHGDQAWGEEGLKAVNHKITYKVTKAMPLGDLYCEHIIEFKEE